MIEISISSPRSCGTCTKCCDGYAYADVYGHIMGFGVPCHFVKSGEGCGIYENRPNFCKTFVCNWLVNDEIPEELKPNLTGSMPALTSTPDGLEFILITNVGNDPREDVLDWYKQYSESKGYGLVYTVNGVKQFMGTKEFVEERRKQWAS